MLVCLPTTQLERLLNNQQTKERKSEDLVNDRLSFPPRSGGKRLDWIGMLAVVVLCQPLQALKPNQANKHTYCCCCCHPRCSRCQKCRVVVAFLKWFAETREEREGESGISLGERRNICKFPQQVGLRFASPGKQLSLS